MLLAEVTWQDCRWGWMQTQTLTVARYGDRTVRYFFLMDLYYGRRREW